MAPSLSVLFLVSAQVMILLSCIKPHVASALSVESASDSLPLSASPHPLVLSLKEKKFVKKLKKIIMRTPCHSPVPLPVHHIRGLAATSS